MVPTNSSPTEQAQADALDGDSDDLETNVDSSLQNNQFAAIASLPPDQLNTTEDMIPVQSDLPPLIDNQDSVNLDTHVTPPSDDNIVATHSHDILDTKLNAPTIHTSNQISPTLLSPTVIGDVEVLVTDSTRSINTRANKPPT